MKEILPEVESWRDAGEKVVVATLVAFEPLMVRVGPQSSSWAALVEGGARIAVVDGKHAPRFPGRQPSAQPNAKAFMDLDPLAVRPGV